MTYWSTGLIQAPLQELRESLTRPEELWSSDRRIGLETLIDENAGWAADKRQFQSAHHRDSWMSAIDDIVESIDNLGKRVKAANPLLQTVIGLFATISQDLNLNKKQAPSFSSRTQLGNALEALKQSLKSSATLGAAFDDLLDCCQDSSARKSTLDQRRDDLWAFAKEASRDCATISRLATLTLSGVTRGINLAREFVGDGAPPIPNDSYGTVTTDVSNDDLICLCRKLFTTPLIPANHIVWLAFENASIDAFKVSVGAIEFWQSEYIRELLQSHTFITPGLPQELKSEGIAFADFPAGRDCVLVRINLGKVTCGNAPELARAQVNALVSLASFRVGRQPWAVMRGHVHIVNEWPASFEGFQEKVKDYSPGFDPIAYELDELRDEVSSHLPVFAPETIRTFQSLEWWFDSKRQTPEAQLLLNVRLLETMASRFGERGWRAYVDKYLMGHWTLLQLRGELNAVTRISGNYGLITDPVTRARIQTWHFRIIESSQDGPKVYIRWKEAYRALRDVLQAVPMETSDSRSLRSVSYYFSSASRLRTRHKYYLCQWAAVSARLERLRNSIAHGGPTALASARSVVQFSQLISAWSVALTVEAGLTGQDLSAVHQARLNQVRQQLEKLAKAKTVDDALF